MKGPAEIYIHTYVCVNLFLIYLYEFCHTFSFVLLPLNTSVFMNYGIVNEFLAAITDLSSKISIVLKVIDEVL